jgi:hypothetical protein
LTPLLDLVLSPPRWFTGTDEQVHLVYELLLTNALPAPATVRAVEVTSSTRAGDVRLGISPPAARYR